MKRIRARMHSKQLPFNLTDNYESNGALKDRQKTLKNNYEKSTKLF